MTQDSASSEELAREIHRLRTAAKEQEDGYLRARAELENQRKRGARQSEDNVDKLTFEVSFAREGGREDMQWTGGQGRPGRGHGQGTLCHHDAEADRRRREVAAHRVTALNEPVEAHGDLGSSGSRRGSRPPRWG